jgi:hypothetical protein
LAGGAFFAAADAWPAGADADAGAGAGAGALAAPAAHVRPAHVTSARPISTRALTRCRADGFVTSLMSTSLGECASMV